MAKVRIEIEEDFSMTLNVADEIYEEYLKQIKPGMTGSEKFSLISRLSQDFKSLNEAVENLKSLLTSKN